MASDRRSITTVLRAETGQYERSMDSAAKATTKVGDAADKVSKQTEGLSKSGKGIGDGAAAGAKKSESALDRMTASVEKNEQAWQTVGTTLTVAGGAVTAFGLAALNAGIEYNTLQQTSRAALESLLGSAQAANAQMDKLDEFARTSPFSKQTFITAQQQMLAFGIEAQKVVPYLDAIQNAVAAAGGSNDDIAGITATMSKIQSSAKITAEDLNELGNRGVNAAELIGSQMGMTGAQVRDAITNGTLDAQAALDALADGMSARFSGAADNVKNTFAGAMDRVKAAWRDFSSELAAPLVDPQGGGALVDMLNGIADAMRGFQDLPDPIKKLAGGLTLFGGAAALAAGSMLLLAPRAIDTVKAFRDLSVAYPRVAGGLKGVAKAAGVAAAAFTAAQLAAAAFGDSIDARSSAQWEATFRGTADAVDLTKASLDGIAGETYNLSDAWRRMKAPSGLEKFDDWSGDVLNMNSSLDTLNAEFENMGQALANMYQDDPAAAQKAFNDVLKQTGASTDELLDAMPAYRDVLLQTQNEQAAAADSAGEMASAQEQLAAALESSNPDIAALAETYNTLIDGASKAGASFLDLSDDLGKAEFSLDGWLKKLESQAEATQKWADNIQKLAEKGASVDLLQGLIEQGPDAAQAVDALANGTEADMKRAEKAIGGATSATAGLQSALSEEFVLQLNTEAAKRQGRSAEEYIAGLQATIEVTGNTVPARKEGESAKAYISRLLAVMGVDADGKPARKEGESTKDYISRLKSYMTINGKSAPARREGESAEAYISRLEARMGIDGDNSQAKASGQDAKNDIDRMNADIKVGADTSSARASANSFIAWANNARATITTNVNRIITEHTRKAKAGGGAVYGPGGPTSDQVPAMLSNGEHVLTARDVQAMGGQSAVYAWRAGLHSGESDAYASGGAVRSAETAVRSAVRRRNAAADALRRARRSKSDKRINAAEKAHEKRQQELADQRARLQRLREEQRDTRTDVRRGSILSSARGGLSGAYGVVDDMLSLARSGDLTKRQSRRLSTSAGNAEKRMRKLYGEATRLEKQLDKAQSKYEDLLSTRNQVRDSLKGGFSLGEVTNPWTGTTQGTTGKQYLASAQAYAAQMKTFASKLAQLQKKGYPGVILQEIAAMGPEAGIPAANALLSLNAKDTKAMTQAYADITRYATAAGTTVTRGFYKGGVDAAKGLVKGLESQQAAIERQITKVAKGMEKALKKALGIKSPSRVFRELGQQTGAGMVLGLTDSVGAVARASEALAQAPGAVSPAVYANPPKAGGGQVVAVVDKAAMAEAMNGMRMTLVADGKPITAIAQTTVDRNLAAAATSLRGGRR